MKNSGILEIIAEEAIMGIAVFEAAGEKRCLYLNRLGRELLEVESKQGVIDLKVDELVCEDRPGMARGFQVEIFDNESLYQDVLVRKKNGLMLVANCGVKHASLEDGSLVHILMIQDITIRKKLQRELQEKQDQIHQAYSELLEQNKQLKDLDHAKDKFIALTTHELRTPLSAIVATAEVLTMELYESPEQKEEFIKTIHEQGLHLMELVNDILDFAKIRAGKMDFFIEQVDLAPLVKKLTHNFDHMAVQNKVQFKVEVPETLLAYVDVMRMKEVVNNVISNAIKYNREEGSVTITITEKDGMARIEVADTGLGIPEDKIKHVFNEFETVGHVSAHHKGTGLGMPISKRLMQSMGGELTLLSVVGEGTSFYIDIPTTKTLADEMYRSRPDIMGDLAA